MVEKAREPVIAGLLASANATSRIPKLPRVGTLPCFRAGGHAILRVEQSLKWLRQANWVV